MKDRLHWLLIALFWIAAGIALYLHRDEFPAAGGGKVLLRDELILLNDR